MKIIKLVIVLMLFLVLSCNNDKNLEKNLLGTWSNVSLQITFANDSIFKVEEGQWEEVFKMKPIKTTYYKGNRYVSEYRDLNDSLIKRNLGRWSIKNDSLYLDSNGIVTSFLFNYDNKRGEFTGTVDWNQDNIDESYYGVQKKE